MEPDVPKHHIKDQCIAKIARKGKRYRKRRRQAPCHKHTTITSSSAPVRPAACWPTACRTTATIRYCCWKRAARTTIPGYTCRSAISRPCTTPGWTGAIARKRTPASPDASCNGRAARCWAAPARSTACCMYVARRKITTVGPSWATQAGAMPRCCPTLKNRKTRNAVPATTTAWAARSRCRTCACAAPSPNILLRAPRKAASPSMPITTAPRRKASATSSRRPARACAAARRKPFCGPPASAATCAWKCARTSCACCSRASARSASSTGRMASCARRAPAAK